VNKIKLVAIDREPKRGQIYFPQITNSNSIDRATETRFARRSDAEQCDGDSSRLRSELSWHQCLLRARYSWPDCAVQDHQFQVVLG
jgi:hypothetical protein